MSKRNSTGYAYLKEWEDYITYGESECTDKDYWYNAYRDTPSKEECDELCKKFSGEIKVYTL